LSTRNVRYVATIEVGIEAPNSNEATSTANLFLKMLDALGEQAGVNIEQGETHKLVSMRRRT